LWQFKNVAVTYYWDEAKCIVAYEEKAKTTEEEIGEEIEAQLAEHMKNLFKEKRPTKTE
jgi:hypothetical protein